MSVNLLSTSVVADFREKLLRKINRLIAKRAALFANMNHYSLDQLSKLIEETNQQLFATVSQATILQVTEIATIPTDNLMAMCDSKALLQEPTQITDDNRSATSSKLNDSHRKRRFSVLTKTEKSEVEHSKGISYYQSHGNFVPLRNGEDEQETREIEAYREMKKKEFEERAKKLAQEIYNKQRAPINLNNQDVVYDFDGRVTTLEKKKERKFKSVPQISSTLKFDYDDKKKRKHMRELMSQNIPVTINEKLNITLRDIEAEKVKKKRTYSKGADVVDTEAMVHVRVNLESHKEHEQAIFVKEPGVKITIKEREINLDKESTRTALTKITRRLSKSEYIQFKADQEKKRIIKNSNLRFIEKKKVKAQEVKTQVLKQEPKHSLEETAKTDYKLSLSLDNNHSIKDGSRIFINNVLGKAELIKQLKHKPYLTEPQEEIKNRRESLSTVDKYNLLYVKYNGNPPESAYENITKELQTQRQQVEKAKEHSINFHQSRKQSAFRENRLISSRKT